MSSTTEDTGLNDKSSKTGVVLGSVVRPLASIGYNLWTGRLSSVD